MSGHRGTSWDKYTIRENGLFLSDVTAGNVSTARHGFAPKLPNDATKFLNGVGGYTVPGGGTTTSGAVFAPSGPKTPIVDADFSWNNQGSSSYTVSARDGSVCLRIPVNNDAIVRGRDKAAPSTPYTVIAYLKSPAILAGNYGYGLYFYETSSTKGYVLYSISVSGVWQVLIFGPTNTGFNLNAGTQLAAFTFYGPPPFFAIRDDGTNRKYYVGEDDEHLLEIASQSRTSGITADRVGFFASPRNPNGIDSLVTIYSWREQSGVPT